MSSGTAEHGGDNFSSKVTSQVPLQYDPNFGISSEITLQRFNLPTQGAYRLNCHRIHLSRGAAQLQCRAYEITRNQVAEDAFVSRNAYCPAHYQ